MRILVLAGGSDQIALIQELHKYNHKVVLLDYLANPPAKPYADKHIQASTLDIDAVVKTAKEEKVDLITTACTDQALMTVADVSEMLGLPCYISHKTGQNVTNKAYMKEVLINNNIPTAKHIIVDSIYGIEYKIHGFDYPLVVKPVDCNSSKGVKKVDNINILKNALKDAITYSRTSYAVVEEYKYGEELSCDLFVIDRTAVLLSVTSSKKIKNRNSFTIIQSYYPVISKEEELCVIDIAQKVVDAFELINCPLLVQMIHNEKGFFILEFSARMGGGSKYKLIEVISGVNIMSEYVKLVLGLPVSVKPSRQVNYVTMNYVYCNPGIIREIKGLKELHEKGIVKHFFEYKTKGMEIEKVETSGDRAIGYLLSASTSEEMDEKILFVDCHISVLNDKGEDMMIHSIWE